MMAFTGKTLENEGFDAHGTLTPLVAREVISKSPKMVSFERAWKKEQKPV